MTFETIIEQYETEVDELPEIHAQNGGGKARNKSGLIYENLTFRTAKALGFDPKKNDYKKSKKTKKRARNEDGSFKADDPTTPENEAWEVTE